MSFEKEIVCKCLFSIISKEPRHEQLQCINVIQLHYGDAIASHVKEMLDSKE